MNCRVFRSCPAAVKVNPDSCRRVVLIQSFMLHIKDWVGIVRMLTAEVHDECFCDVTTYSKYFVHIQ